MLTTWQTAILNSFQFTVPDLEDLLTRRLQTKITVTNTPTPLYSDGYLVGANIGTSSGGNGLFSFYTRDATTMKGISYAGTIKAGSATAAIQLIVGGTNVLTFTLTPSGLVNTSNSAGLQYQANTALDFKVVANLETNKYNLFLSQTGKPLGHVIYDVSLLNPPGSATSDFRVYMYGTNAMITNLVVKAG